MDTLEYSVCEDCFTEIAYCDGEHDISHHIERELGGREGHFSTGIMPTEDDPEGHGEEEFSWQQCELCQSSLGGRRYGVTLFIRSDGK